MNFVDDSDNVKTDFAMYVWNDARGFEDKKWWGHKPTIQKELSLAIPAIWSFIESTTILIFHLL